MTEVQEHNRQILDRVRVHRDELYESILGLEAALSAPARERIPKWSQRVHGRVGELRAQFDRHVEVTEHAGGLFEDVMEQAPRLSHAIDQLRRDHLSLQASLDESLRRVDGVVDDHGVDEVRNALLDLIRTLLEHRQRGAELVYETYDVDLGAAD